MTLMRAITLFLALLVIALTGLALPAGRAAAFVVEGPRDGASGALDNLDRAPRWGLTAGSLVASGERGLGGGLEYAIDDSVCALSFIDGSTCDDVRAAIAAALARWSEGHPGINFRDVSGTVEPAYPLAAAGWDAQGAEIDFLAVDGLDFPAFRDSRVTGYTLFYERPAEGLVLTNGQVLSGLVGRIESADVRINAGRCYYIDLAQARRDCVHFPSLLLHEIGHALGIGHPDDRMAFNLARREADGVVDCRDPRTGLVVEPAVNGSAVMIGQDVQGPGRWKRGLSGDDMAARDALYPHCAMQVSRRGFVAWGAYAVSPDGSREGRAQLADDGETAAKAALSACGTDCLLVARFDGCFALARGADGAQGVGRSPVSSHARVDAVLACSETGRDCTVVADFCAFD